MSHECKIMGILNLTPDSFSDGGQYPNLEAAVSRVKQMEVEGADIIDIGGESTGPGSIDVSEEEEIKRIIPALKEIRKKTTLPISIDTYKAAVAQQALEHGADMINDISALRFNPKLALALAKSKCPIIMMHSKDPTARTSTESKIYKDVIKHIKDFFIERIDYAQSQGIDPERIIIDPGMGQFISSNPRFSYEIIARLKELKELGNKILIGISRKSFLGGDIDQRDISALPLTAIAYLNGASIIRTHNIKGTKELLKSLKTCQN